MGQTSAGMSDSSDRFCLCMMDNEDKNDDIANWILCKGCENWFHRKCNFVSDDEYERVVDGKWDWYCFGDKCKELEALEEVKDDVRPVIRERLSRKCKGRKLSSGNLFIDTSISGRVTCEVCGFLAKNAHGLSIHMRKHRRVNVVDLVSKDNDCGDVFSVEGSLSSILDDFGMLLNRCRVSVPLTRIIQKSVRIVVCQELAIEIENLVWKNDVI